LIHLGPDRVSIAEPAIGNPMTQINPKKLLNSKWTAVQPSQKEKHFRISEVEFDEEGVVTACFIEAVMSNNFYAIEWQDLKDSARWLQGWK